MTANDIKKLEHLLYELTDLKDSMELRYVAAPKAWRSSETGTALGDEINRLEGIVETLQSLSDKGATE